MGKFDKKGPKPDPKRCHIHNHMRRRKPELEDAPPLQKCFLCARIYCADHEGEIEGTCETNHVTHYETHPKLRYCIYESYEDWEKRTGKKKAADQKKDAKDAGKDAAEDTANDSA